MSWSADSLQLALFSSSSSGGQPDALQSWISLFEAPPQAYFQNPPGVISASQASGASGPRYMTVRATPGRLELIASGSLNALGTSDPLVDLDSELDELATLSRKLLIGDTFIRVGLVANLTKRMSKSEDANADFLSNTGLSGLPAGASDLSFGINVRRPSSVPTVPINRLCRWSSLVMQAVQLQMYGTGVATHAAGSEESVSGLQIDVNTPQQTAPFRLDELATILDDLVTEAKLIAKDGYDRLRSNRA